MIALDTNVLVRYVAQDDSTQSARAEQFIESECSPDNPGFIGLVTLVELVWVCESCYDASREDVIRLLRQILSTKQLAVQDADIVWQALKLFDGGPADFSDYLIERIAHAHGCESVVTFDKTAAKAGMTLLKV
ncbi:MAG: type II toxin-antitoxin system VapC family toxin [Candidatus Obscuribacterales bacterium]|nr:type II toxin-antitoxin system VapC family toxin [Candidatus Obscuribacterales bacterium]